MSHSWKRLKEDLNLEQEELPLTRSKEEEEEEEGVKKKGRRSVHNPETYSIPTSHHSNYASSTADYIKSTINRPLTKTFVNKLQYYLCINIYLETNYKSNNDIFTYNIYFLDWPITAHLHILKTSSYMPTTPIDVSNAEIH
jgi:hypothetical protein